MITDRRKGWCSYLGRHGLGLAGSLPLLAVVAIAHPLAAQIVPDQTLGAESSQVVPAGVIRGVPSDRIDGGALRGFNLFHSFLQFGVEAGRGAYFTNPAGVQNILGRVTGSDPSRIMGRLGVLGGANLYLLNPNGIVFGPNSSLDVTGSFTASTASSIQLGANGRFSVTEPETSTLLSVQPGALFLSALADQAGGIVNQGTLVAGRNLTLAAGSVNSTGRLMAPQGQVLVTANAGDAAVRQLEAQTATLASQGNLLLLNSQLRTTGDLTLQADNQVIVRDSSTSQVSIQSGGNLLLQGNQGIDILALRFANTPFQSGGSTRLVSDGFVSADSHFYSGNGFAIATLSGTPAAFGSLYDPIISSIGNVTFGAYTGPALKVEATGSITVTGDIIITGPDIALTQSATIGSPLTLGGVGTAFNGTLTNTSSTPATSIELFLGLAPASLSGLGNGTATVGSALTTTFTAAGGETLSFDWRFDTTEAFGSPFNDFAFTTLALAGGGAPTLTELVDANTVPFVAPRTGNNAIAIATPGTYTFGVGVVNVGDTFGNTNLSVANFLLTPPGTPPGAPSTRLNITPSTDPDIRTLQTTPALILRAGTTLQNAPNVPQTLTSPPGIVPPVLTAFAPAGAATVPATITVNGNIDTSSTPTKSPGTVGGPVVLEAPGNISVSGGINSASTSGTNGGSIRIVSSNGNIAIQPLAGAAAAVINSSSDTASGGDLLLNARGTISLQNVNVVTNTTGAGSAGNIELFSQSASTNPAAPAISIRNSSLSAAIGGATANLDTMIFLFTPAGTLLPGVSSNDDSSIDQGAGGSSPVATGFTLTRDSYLRYNFTAGGDYIIGVGGFPSFLGGTSAAPLAGSPLRAGSSYVLNVSLPGVAAPGGRESAEVEPNNTIPTAQNINSAFTRGANPNVENSATIPYASISASGNNTYDYYRFTVPATASPLTPITGIFDIDSGVGGSAGSLAIRAPGLIAIDNSGIDATTFGAGRGGDILVESGTQIDLRNASNIRTTVGPTSTGIGGAIFVSSPLINLSGRSTLDASNNGAGVGGAISVTSSGRVTLTDSSIIRTTATGSGRGGFITVNTRSLSATGGSRLEAQTLGTAIAATAGDITVNAAGGTVLLDGVDGAGLPSGIFTSTEAPDSGLGGNISVTTGDLIVSNRAVLSARTNNNLFGGNIVVNVNTLSLLSGGQLITSAANPAADGIAGNITVNARNGVGIGGVGTVFVVPAAPNEGVGSGLFAQAEGTGDAGSLIINTPRLSVVEGGRISATTNSGFGEDIQLRGFGSTDQVSLSMAELQVANGSITASTRTGVAGDVSVNAASGIVGLSGANAEISASATEGNGVAGGLTIFGRNVVVDGARLRAETVAGVGGGIQIQSQNLRLLNNARISAASDSGIGGDILLQGIGSTPQFSRSIEELFISNSTLSASTRSGTAGTIFINASRGSVGLTGPAADLSVSATVGTGTAGGLTLFARNLLVSDGARIRAETVAGSGGDIQIFGQEVSVSTGGQISASTVAGQGGSIRVDAKDLTLALGRIFSRSTGAGNAGAIILNVGDRFRAFGGEVSAASELGGGGLIFISARDIRLRGSSLISSSVFNGAGGGGSITFNSRVFIALEDSDILANAVDGRGGNIRIVSPVFAADIFANVGRNPGRDFARFRGNGRVDISAVSQAGISGITEIPDFTFLQNDITDLASNFVDSDRIVAGSCIARRNVEQGSFTVTGLGGLPPTPYDALGGRYDVIGVRSLSGGQIRSQESGSGRQEAGDRRQEAGVMSSSTPVPPPQPSAWKPGDPIQEAQAMVTLPDGRVLLDTMGQIAAIAQANDLICNPAVAEVGTRQ